MVDRARGDLVVAHEAGEDRQAGGVGARPAVAGAGAFERRFQIAPEPACQPFPGAARRTARTACSCRDRRAARGGRRRPRCAGARAAGRARDRTRRRSRSDTRTFFVEWPDDGVGDAVPGERAEVGMHRRVEADRADHARPSRRRPAAGRRARSTGCSRGRSGSCARRGPSVGRRRGSSRQRGRAGGVRSAIRRMPLTLRSLHAPDTVLPACSTSRSRNEFTASQQYIAIAVWYDGDDAAAARRPLLPPGARGAEPRDDDRAVPDGRRSAGARSPASTRCAPSSRHRRAGRAGARPGAARHRRRSRRSPRPRARTATSMGEQFMQWFLKEQVEEVASMTTLLRVVERAADNALQVEEYLSRENASEARRSDRATRGRRRALTAVSGSARAAARPTRGRPTASGRPVTPAASRRTSSPKPAACGVVVDAQTGVCCSAVARGDPGPGCGTCSVASSSRASRPSRHSCASCARRLGRRVHGGPLPRRVRRHVRRRDGDATLNLAYECRVGEGEPRAADDVAELAWFAPSELPAAERFAF